jgi:hypothetical protein
MNICLRKFAQDERPGPGELWVRARVDEHGDCRALAELALTHGPDAFQQGPGPLSCIVVPAESSSPTFDDMLAAALLRLRLQGQEPPESVKPLARYAALIRLGLRPSSLPLKQSLEGIYLAVRNEAGPDLAAAEAEKRFLSRWEHLFAHLLRATAAGADPFKTPLFEDAYEFAQERTYLRRDQEVYRQDVLRGERWRVKMPDGPPEASGLLLRKPRSLLFQHWSRCDKGAPTGDLYLFLAVDWGEGDWVFSTDPVMGLSLKGLAEQLQAAEAARAPARARANPWYDGKAFDHTLVAAPRGGTRLSEGEIRRVVRGWTQGTVVFEGQKPALPSPGGRLKSRLAAVVVALALAAGAWILVNWLFASRRNPTPDPYSDHQVEIAVNGDSRGFRVKWDDSPDAVVFSRTVEAELQPGDNTVDLSEKNAFHQERPVQVWARVEAADGSAAALLKIRKATVNGAPLPLDGRAPADRAGETPRCGTTLKPGHNALHFQVTNEGPKAAKARLRFSWRDDPARVDLYVLAVGVSKYQHQDLSLEFAEKDATALAKVFKSQKGKLFREVHCEVLCDERATTAAILQGLQWLKNSAREHDLVIVTFAGHGDKHPNSEQFYLLPTNFDPGPAKNPNPLAATGALGWEGSVWKDYLSRMPCRVVVLMDACHSGAIKLGGMRARAAFDPEGVKGALEKFTKARQRRGVVVLAACMKDQKAFESAKWGHGLLTKVVLDCLQNGRGVITLAALRNYVEENVRALANQDVVVMQTENLSFPQIPIYAAPAPKR